jgi:hypothetical protein
MVDNPQQGHPIHLRHSSKDEIPRGWRKPLRPLFPSIAVELRPQSFA